MTIQHSILEYTLFTGLVMGLGGCASPFAQAASSYAEATQESAAVVATAPSTANRLCRENARLAYLASRLLAGLPAAPEEVTSSAAVSWKNFFTTVRPDPKSSQTWEGYCDTYDRAGKLYGEGVASIRGYGDALGSLAAAGEYDGAPLQSIAASAGGIAGSLGNDGIGGVIKPIGGLTARIAGFAVARQVERELEAYVVEADPMVQQILDVLLAYHDALTDVLASTEHKHNVALLALETRGGLVGAAADPTKLIEFYELAVAMDDDIRETRTILARHQDVLKAMKSAHTGLVKAGEGRSKKEIRAAITAITALLEDIQALESALAKEG